MDHDTFLAWHFAPVLSVAAAALAALACYVALDLSRRLAGAGLRAAIPWLLGAALAEGQWSVHFLALAHRPLHLAAGYGGAITLAVWAGGVLAGALALRWAFAGRTRPAANLAAELLLTATAVGGPVLYLVDMRLAPAPHWQPLPWRAPRPSCWPWRPGAGWIAAWRWRAAAAVLAGTGLVGVHHAVLGAAQVSEGAVSLHEMGWLADTTLALLAGVATLALSVSLLALSIMEARMRRALRAAIARVEESSRTDALTRLPNRRSFEARLDAVAQHAVAAPLATAVLFIGLDQFKQVNDSFGRRIGDLMLQAVAERLRGVIGRGGLLARAGGDEFVLLLGPGSGRPEAAAMAQQLLEALAEPVEIEQRSLGLGASIGVVLYPRDGSLSAAMANAEAASHYAKRNGGSTFAFFEPRMLGDAREQVELLRDLRHAVAKNQLELVYQPKVHAPSGEIMGAEGLLRWHHPERGMVSPASFIPLAERHGLIVTLGQWVIEEACRQARAWELAGPPLRVGINLSPSQLQSGDLARTVA
ncbi:putative bifunctional diguanylate cyclase/phosphodiesterase, partial [Piscinibacter sp.]|uniref:putative bifunctional diguanylate cyclase/phosphodiesterase n=1 Tax=Piscinibacter sp. TaxID=1903157 RepID=UPI003784342D